MAVWSWNCCATEFYIVRFRFCSSALYLSWYSRGLTAVVYIQYFPFLCIYFVRPSCFSIPCSWIWLTWKWKSYKKPNSHICAHCTLLLPNDSRRRFRMANLAVLEVGTAWTLIKLMFPSTSLDRYWWSSTLSSKENINPWRAPENIL